MFALIVSDPWREKPLSRPLFNAVLLAQELKFQIPGGKNPLADKSWRKPEHGTSLVSDPWREKPLSRHPLKESWQALDAHCFRSLAGKTP